MQETQLIINGHEIERYKQQIADMLLDFRPSHHCAWPTRQEAVEEVEESLQKDKKRISILAALDREAVGWIAGFETYSHAFEVHPLVVRFDRQKMGIGRKLLEAFEKEAADTGALTVYLGSDDHISATTLGGIDLFPNVLSNLGGLRNLKGHPYEFYQRCGYEIVGVLPDVNGKGQPDIWMAKSVASSPFTAD